MGGGGGGGGAAEFSSKKKGGGVQPLSRKQFVLQMNKIFSKRRGSDPLDTPLDLPLCTAAFTDEHYGYYCAQN